MKNKEINRLIAEKVMGWKQVERSLRDSEGHYDTVCWDKGHMEVDSFRPSTDIRHAWLVAEKLYISVTPQCGAPHDMQCLAELDDESQQQVKWEAFAETAPLAICKVALRSYGIEI